MGTDMLAVGNLDRGRNHDSMGKRKLLLRRESLARPYRPAPLVAPNKGKWIFYPGGQIDRDDRRVSHGT